VRILHRFSPSSPSRQAPPPGVVWRKSSHSQGAGAECVELADLADTVAVRDSKDPSGPRLVFARAQLAAFLTAVSRGDHDL
jgi:hypothetical protein